MTIYEDTDFLITCSGNEFDKFVIFLNSAAGLDRVVLDGVIKAHDKAGTIPNGIYTPYSINEINFLCKNANWYQRKSVETCISVIKKIIAGYEKTTVIYGSSMGGFGAIHLGAELGITSIAFSPQATLEDEFGITWDWKKISEYSKSHFGFFNSNIINGKCNDSKIYIFYDGRHILDKKHALYIIKKCKNCISFNIPYAGHACTNIVNKYYKIKNIVIDILNGDFDSKKFRKNFFSLYNIYEYKRMNALDYFYFLTNIIHDRDFYITLACLNKTTYRDLCISLLHIVENKYSNFVDSIIMCMCNKDEIIKNAISNTVNIKYKNIEIESESERIMVCALFYYNRKKYTKALVLYSKLYNSEKTNIDLCIMLANTMHKIGLDDEAFLLLQESIVINGKNNKLLSCLSVILFEKKTVP